MYSASLLSDMVKTEKSTGNISQCGRQDPSSGIIDAPIRRVDGSTIERQVDYEQGDYACTHYKRLCYKNGYSLVSLTLKTGRTHQIRVHMKHIGHPLPGDFLYNPNYHVIKRQALHSHCLSFEHPITKNRLTFSSPLPDDMAIFFNNTNQETVN